MSVLDEKAYLASRLQEVFWVPFDVEFDSGRNGFAFSGRPHSDQSDRIKIVVHLINTVRLDMEAVPESLCRPFIETMAGAEPAKRKACQNSLLDLEKQVEALVFDVGGVDLVHTNYEDWPAVWPTFKYGFIVRPLPCCESKAELFHVAEEWVVNAFRPIFDLLDVSIEGNPEGDVQHSLSNKYERDRSNREACIAYYGTKCAICGFDFEQTYGPLGSGFIHVHHIVPVSKVGPGYVIDPINDLIPVCPNCHAMLHRTDPPLSPDYLKMVLAKNAMNG